MPLVTDSDKPRGAPAATTVWPTCSESDLAKTAGVRFCSPSTLMTARSLVSDVPTTVAGGGAAIVESHGDGAAVGRSIDHVSIGQDVALVVDHHAATEATVGAVLHVDGHQRGVDLGRSRSDGAVQLGTLGSGKGADTDRRGVSDADVR